ncbi:MAG TPA: hypothetical protein VK501_04040 [Baekduia sp.]|uniref:hypothetical protein n=1 Tax=Baekduia sp. TaxID=2600305 RepID=UPI002CDC6239|nr:hypothetical protein [Baekduia sp.]HMJ33067.1 hypothetical protein [Baekduia sp.]
MTGATLDAREAGLVVEARLGRAPQDMLEAAVVLEAWAGVPAQAALAAARTMMPPVAAAPQRSVGRLPRPRNQEGVLLDGAAFVVTVIAIACWAAPLGSSVGVAVVEHALMLALPLTLALQWALGSRFLDRPHGVAQLADHRGTLILGAVAVLVLPSLAFGLGGTLAGLLTITWTGGTLLMRRRWPAVYVLAILLATVAMVADAEALAVVGVTAAVTTFAVVAALWSSVPPVRRSLGRWERAVMAGAIGVGLGLMLILDRTVSWTDGAVPALALLPSAVAGFWGGYHLRHLDQAIPSALSGVPVGVANARGLGRAPVRVLLETLGRFLLLCGALSATLLSLTPWLGDSARGAGVLVGFAVLALASMLVGLLESMGRGRWALLAVGVAAGAEAAIRFTGADPFPGAGLVVAGTLCVVLVLPAVLGLLRRPARTLATALWIP